MPGFNDRDAQERRPIVKFSKQTNRISWISESEFGTDDELAFKRGNRLHRLQGYKQRCSRSNKKRIAAIVVVPIFLLIVVGLVYLYYANAKTALPISPVTLRATVSTECGPVEGIIAKLVANTSNSVHIFKGIPYALAPHGDRRWKPPQGLKASNSCWDGVLSASSFPNSCPQIDLRTGEISGSEDCLYLNIWTPSLDAKSLLPVLMFIHGGGLTHFSGSLPWYRPTTEMVTSSNVVAISFNYRLNAFGFLSLDCLSNQSTSKSSGNFGFMDQVLVLEWVHRNIANFGGDPARVSLVGHEAGATSAMVMHQSPLTRDKGLFRRIVATSGPSSINVTYKEASLSNKVFLNNSQCNRTSLEATYSCILNLTMESVLLASPWHTKPNSWSPKHHFDIPAFGSTKGVLAVLDPVVLPQFNPDCRSSSRVDIMIGSNAQEIDLSPYAIFGEGSDEYNKLLQHLNDTLATFSPMLPQLALTMYNQSGDLSNQVIYESIATDIRLTCSLDKYAYDLSSVCLSSNVYRYIVRTKPSAPVYHRWYRYAASNAFSMWDIHALLGLSGLAETGFYPNIRDVAFSKLFRSQVFHFLRYGHPLTASWMRFPATVAVFQHASLQLSSNAPEQQTAKCSLWKKHKILDYSWVY